MFTRTCFVLMSAVAMSACSSSTTDTDGGITRDVATVVTDAGGSTNVDASRSDSGVRTDGSVTPSADASSNPSGRYFPAGAWMYQDISNSPLHARSQQTTDWLVAHGGWGLGRMQIDRGIVVNEATAATPYMRRTLRARGDYTGPDCDEVEFPIPTGGAVEANDGLVCTQFPNADCHFIVIDRRTNRLFEAYQGSFNGTILNATCITAWDMTRVYGPEGRGEQCTSADAAGFPIAPLLFTTEEVAAGEIAHAIRFILPNARMRRGFYVRPATHAGGPEAPDADAPVYGSRWRLKASFDLGRLPNEAARVVARAMQRYGMALSDGGNVALTAANDRASSIKWEGLLGTRDLAVIQPSDFEVIDTGPPITLTYDCVRTPY